MGPEVADSLARPIEEILVTAVDRCGPWPIAHEAVAECFYPEWKRHELGALKTLRDRYRDLCLSCSETACRPGALPPDARRERFYCRRLFQTPRWVPRLRARVLDAGYLAVEFAYEISGNGRVRGVRILSLDSDLPEEVVLEMITEAARAARFEPIEVGGRRLPLVDLTDTYVLED